jgi:hypothetical protein
MTDSAPVDIRDDPLFAALIEDYHKCTENLHANDNQFWRRTLFRTAFSFIESLNGLVKEKAVLALCSRGKKQLNITKIELLQDFDHRISKTGKLESQQRRQPFLNYTAFILRCLAEESNTEATFFSDNGWNEFQKALDVRHRLTHPKKAADMNVSDEELHSLEETFRWYTGAIGIVLANKKFWTSSAPEEKQS